MISKRYNNKELPQSEDKDWHTNVGAPKSAKLNSFKTTPRYILIKMIGSKKKKVKVFNTLREKKLLYANKKI